MQQQFTINVCTIHHALEVICLGNKSELARQLGVTRNTVKSWLRQPDYIVEVSTDNRQVVTIKQINPRVV